MNICVALTCRREQREFRMLLFVFIFPIEYSRVQTNYGLKDKICQGTDWVKIAHPTVDDMVNSNWDRCPEKFKSYQTKTENELM